MCPLVRIPECLEKFHILQRDVPSQTLPIAGRLAQKSPDVRRPAIAGCANETASSSSRISRLSILSFLSSLSSYFENSPLTY